MKRLTIISIILSVLFYAESKAQSGGTLLMYKDGQVINIFKLKDIDSIKFTSCYNDCGIVKDFDGNVYNTVMINTQCWMQKNLNTTHYNNGDTIPKVTDNTQWNNLVSGAYCNYDNDSVIALTYGRLYNWYVVSNNNICPTGWHVPADSEWTVLSNTLGGDTAAGRKMKEAGFIHWHEYCNNAINSSGFTALPGGYRNLDSNLFEELRFFTIFWSATNLDASYSSSLTIQCYNSSIGIGGLSKKAGLSIRCLKNN